jgi:predicted transcriptional regulator
MALLDIFKMKKLGGTVLLKDNSFLYISKVTGTQFEPEGKDMRILYEDGNGVKKEFMISQVKEAQPVEEQPHPLDAPFSDGKQSVFTLLNNMNKLKECEGYFITNDGNRIQVYRVLEFNDMKVTWIGIYDGHKRTADFRYIKEAHISNGKSCALLKELHKNSEIAENDPYKLTRQFGLNKINLLYVPPETLDKNCDYQGLDYEELSHPNLDLVSPFSDGKQPSQEPHLTNSPDNNNDLGSFKKRKITEVPLMDDDLEQTLNRTKEINYKLIEDLIDVGVEKFEFASQTVPNDVYEILIMSKGKKKWFAVLQNDNEDVFILDMNSLFIVNAIFDKSKSVQSTNAIPNLNTSVEEPSVKIETKSQDYPGGPWFLNKRRKLDVSSVQDIIRGDNCKSIIVPGEPSLYNAYLNRDLKETMIENLIKKELSNDLNILLSETEGKYVLIYLGDDTRPYTLIKIIGEYQETYGLSGASGPVSDIPQPIIESIEITGNDVVKVKTTPLPAHLKCLAPTRYTEDLRLAPSSFGAIGSSVEDLDTETYFTPKKNREIKVPDAPRKKSSHEDPSNLNINDMVTFLYKGEEKRVLVKESNDKYLEGICQEQNKYKKYLVRYIERPRVSLEKIISYRAVCSSSSDDETDIDIDSSEETPINMTYKRMILNSIKDMYVNGTKGCSRQAIQAYLMANYKVNLNRFQDNIRRTLKRLVETGCIVQTKQKFKLGDEGRKYLKTTQGPFKKFTLKELKPVKKVNPGANNSNPQPNRIQSKTDLIQYAIDNEKILDIMYDGGSIPDIKRPIRPLKIFKTAYSKKEILQATCLIDDNIKNFTLDKVTVITFIEE